MAVTARKTNRVWAAALLIGALCGASLPLRADDSADVHAVIGAVGEALSSGDPALAMSWFSKSCPDYQKLSDDFTALGDAYFVENEVDFTDEDVRPPTATVTVQWTMTLTTRQTGFTKNRKAELTFKMYREGKHWRITSISSIGIFDPQAN